MKNLILITIHLFVQVSCTKEKIVFITPGTLTNSENNRIITEKRAALDLYTYTENLPFFPNYSPKVGDVLYNNTGLNESLIVAVNGTIAQTFEGVRDSSRLFYRRMSITQTGDFAAFPCSSSGEKTDSADIYLYHKY